MLFRCLIVAILLLAVYTPAWASDLYPLPDPQVAAAARQFREKNYKDAWESALKAPQGGIREFLLGFSAVRLEEWTEAADHLAKGADSFPLLADYAFYNQARALYRLARFTEALPPLQRLIREFPESPLFRPALLLQADTLFEAKDFKTAYGAYQKFVEKFPSGTDSVSANHKSALCLEQMGETAAAVKSLRNIWLKYPASAVAAKAEDDLKRLSAKGVKVEPYSAEELLRRAAILFDLRKYDLATKAFRDIPPDGQPEAVAARNLLKTGQALYRSRKYKDAEATLSALLARKPGREIADEAAYWLAKALDRNGREEEAFATFMKLAESSTGSDLAGKALFEAAQIRKGQKRGAEALAILKRILLLPPASSLKQSITWEIAWGSYRAGDMKTAAECFKSLAETDDAREKALYWLGRARAASDDIPGAQEAIAGLLAEYPFGFYAQTYRKEVKLAGEEICLPTGNMCEVLPVPAGFERVKALIALGLRDEARKELSASRKKQSAKNGALPGIARLYLEMEDYNGAYNLLRNERPRKFEKDNLYQWGISFPQAYRDQVTRLAADHNVPESLVYAVIRAESSFLPTALSPAGAVGLMQLMPATAAAISGGKGKADPSVLTRPEVNIRYGIRHLRDLLTYYDGDPALAVAAYNAGSGNVDRWRERFGKLPADEFIESIPFGETREYVKKVLASADIYSRLYKADKQPAAASPSPAVQGSAPQPAESLTPPPASDTAASAVSTSTPTEPDVQTELPTPHQL